MVSLVEHLQKSLEMHKVKRGLSVVVVYKSTMVTPSKQYEIQSHLILKMMS